MARPSRAPGAAAVGAILSFARLPSLGVTALARHVANPAAKATMATLALLALLTALGVCIVRASLGDALSAFDPALSVSFDASQTHARIALARRALAADPAHADAAISIARDAVDDNPLAPDALAFLARAREHEGDLSAAADLMALAARIDPRDLTSELWLLDRDMRDARVVPALVRFDILSRGQMPEVLSRLTPALAPILMSAAYRAGFVALLRADPPWRSFWLRELISRSDDFAGLTAVFADLRDGANPPTLAEFNGYLTRLTEAGLFEPAYRAWLRALPPDPGGRSAGLFNGRFDRPLTNLPFDWQFAPARQVVTTVVVRASARILNVEFLGGRMASEQASHLMKLAPGSYRLSGRERSLNLLNERGLRWRVSCAVGARQTLAVTDLLAGDTPWRFFDVSFAVPEESCPFQKLVLELPARIALETEILGAASYADLDIQAR
jgi:tetratricopeptide (TPR) repeat protein